MIFHEACFFVMAFTNRKRYNNFMQRIVIKNIDEFHNEQFFKDYYEQMDDLRKAKIDKCKNLVAKRRSLAAGVAIREALLEYGIPVERQIIIEEEKGKLILANDVNTFFSVSHSGKYAIAVVYDKEIGIDVEEMNRTLKAERMDLISEKCFSSAEKKYYKEKKDRERFFELWTRKEALLKAKGIGLSSALKDMDTFQIGRFETKKLNEDYIFTICTLE